MTDPTLSISEVRKAAKGLANVVMRTPLLENEEVNARLGGRLLVKAECAQRTGAFKIRGAYWRMQNLSRAQLERGVITYSSGNHALGVARAGQMLNSSALIVMPSDAPQAKVSAVRNLGAEIETYDRDNEDYNVVVERLRQQTGRVHIPTSAHAQILAGAGTVALELIEQAESADARLDSILTPCGSGGLTAASAVVANHLLPDTEVFAVEPEHFDDTRRSLLAGKRIPNAIGARTICDAIMTPIPNEVTFPINQTFLAGGLVVSDNDVRNAMRLAFEHYKIVVEPGAAVGIAAILNRQIDIAGKTVATVITGGNIDIDRFCDLVTSRTD